MPALDCPRCGEPIDTEREPAVLGADTSRCPACGQHEPDHTAGNLGGLKWRLGAVECLDSVGDGGVVALTVEPRPNLLVASEVAGAQINGVEDIPLKTAGELRREDRVVWTTGRDVRLRCGP